MEYEITLYGVTYTVEPLVDDGELFAVIQSASGLEQYGPDELPGLFDDEAHQRLSRELEKILRDEGCDV